MAVFWQRFLGARVVKTSIAAGLALYLSAFLHFPGSTYAALVAVLATQKSLARSFGLAKYQIASALLGTLSGNLAAVQFGGHPVIAGLLVYFLFRVHLRLGWRNTILISIVTGLNSLFTFQGEFAVHAAKQMAVVLIGIGCSIAVNLLAVPRYEQRLEELTSRAEGMLRGLLYLMQQNLMDPGQRLSKEDFTQQVQDVRGYIEEARHYAELIFEDQWMYNQRGRAAGQAIETLRQLERLTHHLLNLYQAVDKVETWVPSIPLLHRFMDVILHVQQRVFQGRPLHARLVGQAIRYLDRRFDEMELPASRQEFVTRASLYHFYVELKEYYQALQQIGEQGKKVHPVSRTARI